MGVAVRREHRPADGDGGPAVQHGSFRRGTELPFGRDDAIDQARVLQALITSAEIAAPVTLS